VLHADDGGGGVGGCVTWWWWCGRLCYMLMMVVVCMCAQPAVCDYSPLHFIRCHFGDKNAIKKGHTDSDPTDKVTNVWCCAMEPDPNNPG